MGTAPKDNYTLPSDKAVWGFAGNADQIIVAPNKAGDEPAITDKPDEKTGRKNGGEGK